MPRDVSKLRSRPRVIPMNTNGIVRRMTVGGRNALKR
jgi:hypothetical protein